MDGIIDPRGVFRGAWKEPPPDPPIACTRCGATVELLAGSELAIGTCTSPGCIGTVAVYRRREGRWALAELLTRPAACPARLPAAGDGAERSGH